MLYLRTGTLHLSHRLVSKKVILRYLRSVVVEWRLPQLLLVGEGLWLLLLGLWNGLLRWQLLKIVLSLWCRHAHILRSIDDMRQLVADGLLVVRMPTVDLCYHFWILLYEIADLCAVGDRGVGKVELH